MTVCKGTSPEDGRETIVLVLDNVTAQQFDIVKNMLEDKFTTLPPHNIDAPESLEWASLFNMLCDLEVEGFEI